MKKPTRRQVFKAAGIAAVVSTVRPIAARGVAAPGSPVFHYSASVVDDVGDPDYIYWPNQGSLGGGLVIRRDMIKRRG